MDPHTLSLQDAISPLTDETTEKTVASSVISENAPVKKTAPSSGSLKSLRTYQGDVEEIIGKKNTSVTSIAIAEQKRKIEQRIAEPEPEKTDGFFTELKNKSFLVAGIWLIVFGLIVVGVAYGIRIMLAKPTVVATKSTIISFTKEIDLPVASSTRTAFIHTVLTDTATFSQPLNSVLYLNTIDIGSQDFLQLLAPDAPPALVRSLDTPYMIGVYAFNTNQPFIILKTTDYEQSFAGMLKWENTIVADIGDIFSIPQDTGTTYTWGDETINNKDLRILSGLGKKTLLLYSFVDKNTIIITTNEGMLTALLGKYVNAQMIR